MVDPLPYLPGHTQASEALPQLKKLHMLLDCHSGLDPGSSAVLMPYLNPKSAIPNPQSKDPELTNPAHAAGFHLTARCCQLLFGALIFLAEIRFFDPVIDEIPGEFLIQITFAEDIKISVYG